MILGFSDDWQSWQVPEEDVLALAERLRTVGAEASDPATGQRVDPQSADGLADALEVGVEAEMTELWVDDRDRPAIRWALESDEYAGGKEWVVGLARVL